MPKKEDDEPAPTDPMAKRPQDWNALERAQIVLEASTLDEQQLGELLRRRGLHRDTIDEWRISLEDALNRPRSGRSAEARRIKELEREVAYKDKALAETAALLVLQKKLSILFPVDEDDDTDESNDK